MDAFVSFRWLALASTLVACASRPPARSLDDDMLSYRATATAVDLEKARFKAEGAALEDLANECSLIPQTTRIETKHHDKRGYENKVEAVARVPLADCMRARPALEPQAIRNQADADLTSRLHRYQNFQETGRLPSHPGAARVEVPEEMPIAPDRDSHWDDTEYFYVLRQTLAYQKQIPVLAPAQAFSSLSEARRFTAAVEPVEALLRAMQKNNPSLRIKPLAWSELKDPVRVARPECLRKEGKR